MEKREGRSERQKKWGWKESRKAGARQGGKEGKKERMEGERKAGVNERPKPTYCNFSKTC